MAIPFFEPKEGAHDATVGDQVDGPGGGNGNINGHGHGHGHEHNNSSSSSPPTPIPISATVSIDLTPLPYATVAAAAATSAPSSEATAEQALAWKLLAVAMCKALKDYYLQTATSSDAFTSAVVQILPNGQIPPNWK